MAGITVQTTRRAQSTPARRTTLPAVTLIMAGLLLLVVSLASPSRAYAAIVPTVGLGTAGDFSVLGGQTVTNTGPSTLDADLGVFPGDTAPGFPPGIVAGEQHLGDAVADQAQQDLTTAYDDAAGRPTNADFTDVDLGGLTLIPGVYTFSSAAQLTGALTLNGQNNPDAVFIFQVGSMLTTATSSSVNLINGASSCNVFWQIGSSATLGVDTDFVGTVLALTSISANTGATIDGRLLARNGQVSLDTNVITSSECRIGPTAPPTSTVTATVTQTATATQPASPPVTVTAPGTTTTVRPTETITITSEATDTDTSEATDTETSTATDRSTAGSGTGSRGGGGDGGGSGGDGGGLASTGASASSGLIAFGGLLLLLLGSLMLVVTRARRTRQRGQHQ